MDPGLPNRVLPPPIGKAGSKGQAQRAARRWHSMKKQTPDRRSRSIPSAPSYDLAWAAEGPAQVERTAMVQEEAPPKGAGQWAAAEAVPPKGAN